VIVGLTRLTPLGGSSRLALEGVMAGLRVDSRAVLRPYLVVVGVLLLLAGVLGFVSNPLVRSSPGAVFGASVVHNGVHLVTGLIALYVAFGLAGAAQASAVIAFGVLYGVILVLVLLSATLFGVFGDAPANAADHLLHGGLAVSALVAGYAALSATEQEIA
jgi:hypothetical protein